MRVQDLLGRMTVEEKVGQLMQLPAHFGDYTDKLEEWHIGSFLHCTGDNAVNLQRRAAETRLGIPLIFGIDAIHGHCFDNDSTVFPTQLSASSSWDKDLMYRMARITAKETRASGLHWTFSPVLCVARDARWGRVNETYGEDPWLIGELAAETIKGYQGPQGYDGESILACAKHYVAYGETLGGRDSYECDTSRRKLLSLFLPPFEKAVKEANVASLMTGYHAIDGIPCTVDKWLLTDVAKTQWGLDGFVVTDWENVRSLHTKQYVCADEKEACLRSLLAGNDMMMSTPEFYPLTLELIAEGRVDMSVVDEAVARVLKKKFELGLFDEMRFFAPDRSSTMGIQSHLNVSLEASLKSMVLLQNNGILPIDPNRTRKVLLIGPNADDVIAQLGDWSFGSMQAGATNDTYHRDQTVTVLQALRNAAQSYPFALEYIKGADCVDDGFSEIVQIEAAAATADLVIACVGDTLAQNGEFHDRADLTLSGQQQAMLEAVKRANAPLVVAFIASKPLTIPWIAENADALICGFNPGPFGGEAVKQVLFGEYNPGGKLTVSFPVHVGQIPVYYNKYTGWHAQNSARLNGEERYIDMPKDPLFSFGYGLSYSTFNYLSAQVQSDVIEPMQDVVVMVTLENDSDRDGTEIVQVYLRDLYSSVTTPIKRLCGFERVELAAGERREIRITIPFEQLALIDANLNKVVEAGEFHVMVGASSRDEALVTLPIRVTHDTAL
ncbi:glycosyl hydrolase [Vibrio sp. SM6]|uniref:beta-glucosidase n=2 Tax=Vibrio agarilyticus TaxID=2726741 RepID=A0A7X8TP93_9VIBR|nr:glycoside hydrolase family 3 N-terminal domain-containing protein [Vibrio agarilyticus]NLS12194.1 glycosyl hydrolase [Vibrio agarilyticus]